MLEFDPQAYGPVFSPMLAIDRRRALDAGTPATASRKMLDALTPNAAFGYARVADRDTAECCIAGIWLLHDYLDESHSISQRIETPSGSLWHAIMHRREGDFSNAKYWFHRAGQHPVLDSIGQYAAGLGAARDAEALVRKLIIGGDWDPCAFVDLCEASANGKNGAHELCRDIQQTEWELLFDFCYRAGSGDPSARL